MTKYGFAINLHRCIGCRTCSISCKMENNVADGTMRIRVLNDDEALVYDVPTGSYPNLAMTWTPVPCQHCDNPPCVEACPTGASTKQDNGLVLIEAEECIGCESCVKACPYDARSINPDTNIADKCTMCEHRLLNGEQTTLCQLSCPGRAIVAGDLDDPESGIAKIIAENETVRLLEESGTGPNVYYWNSVRQ
ncbi:4Fe-4S dicluster domain-containing protein [Adlercreutzia muris]|uniref:4Fe-4S dicluster domain-containing protein n=1 Tax=Adlercreutzia muris TaxID=1796610 RepID=UPI003514FACE